MSTVRWIVNALDENKDGLLASFWAATTGSIGRSFRRDITTVELYAVQPTNAPSGSRFWDAYTIADPADVTLGVGLPDAAPVLGSAQLTWGGDTATIPYNSTASAIQTLLLALPSISGALGVTVSMPQGINDGFLVRWSEPGSRDLFTGDAYTLEPDCTVVITRVQAGDSTHSEVQLVQFVQRPYLSISDVSAISTPLVTVLELRTGDGSNKAKYQITLSDLIYDGTFSVDSSDGTGTSVAWNGEATDLTAAMAGAWTATKVTDRIWTVERDDTGTATIDLSTGVVTTGLVAYTGVTGTLSVNSASLWRAFAATDADFLEATLQIRIGDETILYVEAVKIYRDILNGSSGSPPLVDYFSGTFTISATSGTFSFPSAFATAPVVALGIICPGDRVGIFLTAAPTTTGIAWALDGTPSSYTGMKGTVIAAIAS